MQQSDRYRLAIAALALDRVVDAVLNLESNSLTSTDLCLAATPDTLNLVAQSLPSEHPDILARLLDVRPLPISTLTAVAATADRPMTTHMNFTACAAPAAEHHTCWLDVKARTSLLDHMTCGRVLVLAGPLTATQLQAGTNILLRYSIHHAQGHLLIPPNPSPSS